MSLRDRSKDAVTTFSGLKSGIPVEATKFTDAIECKNFRLKEGKLQRVNGTEDYGSVLPDEDGGVTSLHEFKHMIVAQRGTEMACENSEGATQFTQITEQGSEFTNPSDTPEWPFETTDWPFGTDGDKTILNGETVTLTSGQIKDYNNLTINAGGILELSGPGWMRIGVKGNLVLNGTIRAISNNGYGEYSSNAIDVSGGSGEVISYSVTPSGGEGGRNGGGNAGASQVNGAGGDGADWPGDPPPIDAVDGGTGGTVGINGGGIWIKVSGTYSGTGQVLINGTAGTNGTPGGSSGSGWSGGGGGGGGGCGGKFIGVIHNNSANVTYQYSGGAGGAGGIGGNGSDIAGGAGYAGSTGTTGILDITNYNSLSLTVQETLVAETQNSSTNRFFSAQWRDRIFFVNGFDTKFLINRQQSLDDFVYGNIGLNAILATPTVNSVSFLRETITPAFSSSSYGAGSTLTPGSTYYYLMTLYDSNTNTESPALGALTGESGLTECRPNGYLGPVPDSALISGGHNSATCLFVDMLATLQLAQSYVPRATHFIIYRSGPLVGTLYNTFYRVSQSHTDSDMVNQVFIDIAKFIEEGLPFIDANVATSVELLTDNSPPPSISSMLATDLVLQQLNNYKLYGGAGDVVQPDTTEYSAFTHIKTFRDQLFAIGAKAPGTYAVDIPIDDLGTKFSGRIDNFRDLLHGSEVFQPDYWPYVWEVGVGDGRICTGLAVLGDSALLIFKESSTYYLSGSSPDNFVVRILDPTKGCLHASTIQETAAGVITLDRSGFMLFSGTSQGQKISKPIQDIIDSIDFSYIDEFYSVYDNFDQRYYCTVVLDGLNRPTLTLCLDIDTMEWTSEEGQEGKSRIFHVMSDGSPMDIIGSYDSGLLLSASNEQIVTARGGGLESIWLSGVLDFGDRQHRKRMQYVYLTVSCASTWEIDLEVIPDYDETRKHSVYEWNVLSSQSTWYSSDTSDDGTLLWDEGTWASNGTVKKICKIPVVCTGYTFQIRIINRGTDNSAYGFEIHQVSCEGIMFKR